MSHLLASRKRFVANPFHRHGRPSSCTVLSYPFDYVVPFKNALHSCGIGIAPIEAETSKDTSGRLREYVYGLETKSAQAMQLRRYGYHGIYHEAACQQITRGHRRMGFGAKPGILSICLERQPEIAAVVGRRPSMVSGGSTPLAGIPGETDCGEIDPSIVLALAYNLGWGPDQINTTLTKKSGLLALAGRPVTLEEVFASKNPYAELAQEVIRYRVLMACGAGMAAMGRLDAVVFSGRFRSVGRIFGPYLESQLRPVHKSRKKPFDFYFLDDSVDRIIANKALSVLHARILENRTLTSANSLHEL